MAESRSLELDNMASNPLFDDVSTKKPSLQNVPDTEWTPACMNRVKIWSDVTLDDAQILAVGKTWIENISQGVISVQTAVSGLRLALSLKSMNPANTDYLFTQQIRLEVPNAEEDTIPKIRVPDIGQFSDTPLDLRIVKQNSRGTEQAETQADAPEVPGELFATETADPQGVLRSSYCFLAAYMMKLLVKSPENVHAGVALMKTRYNGFYSASRIVQNFNLTLGRVGAYKECLISQAGILSTYGHAIAYTHQNKVEILDLREVGVLSYLAFLHFSYTGLHCYTLMIDLMNISQVPLHKLLTLFYADINARALLKIATIVRDYERTTEEPRKDLTFRYSTLFAPQYFADLRSKSCPYLLYTIANAWKCLNVTFDNADPIRIAAAGRLSEQMKATLASAGYIIGNTLKKSMLSGNNSSEAYRLALNLTSSPQARIVEDPVGEEYWMGHL